MSDILIDDDLIYEMCLWKWNYGMKDPVDIKLCKVEVRKDDILVSFQAGAYISDRHTLRLEKSEYLSLFRQKRLKSIAI